MRPELSDCWAKTNFDTGIPVLTVRDHCIHVGAVAEEVIKLIPRRACDNLPKGASTLVALHDIGKITLGFQKKCSHWKYFPEICNTGLEGNHAKVSQIFLGDLISERNAAHWSISLGGHHGRYNSDRPRIRGFKEAEREWMQNLRLQLCSELVDLFGQLPNSPTKPSNFQLHWFTGLITFADWIGSNEEFFPLPEGRELKNHTSFKDSEKKAREALSMIQWTKVTAQKDQTFSSLFPFQPNRLQKIFLDACDSPGLYIVEATMGMGKTEAALSAAYQRWQSGDERGIYFALPTQLTSNRIYERISPFLEKSISSTTMQINASNSNDQSSSGNDALKWFSSSRRALLAPFGVGTIDQALLSILHTKYASLRFFGLAGKTVILDEVHSYDPYTFQLICKLVEELTKIGSTVIVLSATLTQKARRNLITAAGGHEEENQPEYPLISAVKLIEDSITTSHYPVPLPEKSNKTFDLKHIGISRSLCSNHSKYRKNSSSHLWNNQIPCSRTYFRRSSS